jgi:hypothetical protein
MEDFIISVKDGLIKHINEIIYGTLPRHTKYTKIEMIYNTLLILSRNAKLDLHTGNPYPRDILRLINCYCKYGKNCRIIHEYKHHTPLNEAADYLLLEISNIISLNEVYAYLFGVKH